MKPGFDYTGLFAVFLCHDGKGKILMSKRGKKARDEQGTWECGGGGIEFGESPQEAVLRELREEYGCTTIHEIQPLLPFSLLRTHDDQRTHWIGFPFALKINPSEASIKEPEYMEEIGWFDLDNLPEPLHPGSPQVIESYRSHFKI